MIASIKEKSNLHFTCGNVPMYVTTVGAHLRGLRRGGGELLATVSDLTGPGAEPSLPAPRAMSSAATPTGQLPQLNFADTAMYGIDCYKV